MRSADIKPGEFYFVTGTQYPRTPRPGDTYDRYLVVETGVEREALGKQSTVSNGVRIRQEIEREGQEQRVIEDIVPPGHVRRLWSEVEAQWPAMRRSEEIHHVLAQRRGEWHDQVLAIIKDNGMKAYKDLAGAYSIRCDDLAQLLRELGYDIPPEPQYQEVAEELASS